MAMIPCNYYINVAKQTEYPKGTLRYVHYCKIELGDIISDAALEKYQEISEMFTKDKGFQCTLYYVHCSAKQIVES